MRITHISQAGRHVFRAGRPPQSGFSVGMKHPILR